MLSIFRLNKIGKNPNLMSQKDDDELSNPDESAINAVVNALAAADQELNMKWVLTKKCSRSAWSCRALLKINSIWLFLVFID